jgi:tetratricopeptide (TPR) repeat protein
MPEDGTKWRSLLSTVLQTNQIRLSRKTLTRAASLFSLHRVDCEPKGWAALDVRVGSKGEVPRPSCHVRLSIISLMTRRHERALRAAQRAIDLNPNLALGHFALGETRLFMGQFGEALDPLMRCLRLSPHHPLASTFVSLIALAHYHLGNYKEAEHHSERALQKRRTYFVLRTLAATLGHLGRTEEARPVLSEMERIKPTNERQWALISPYADPAYEEQILDSLHLAGLPAN